MRQKTPRSAERERNLPPHSLPLPPVGCFQSKASGVEDGAFYRHRCYIVVLREGLSNIPAPFRTVSLRARNQFPQVPEAGSGKKRFFPLILFQFFTSLLLYVFLLSARPFVSSEAIVLSPVIKDCRL